MFSNNLGTDANIQSAGPRFLLSVTRDVQSCLLFLKLVNASADAQTIEFGLLGAMAVKTTGKPVTLRATTKEATNSINNPTNTVPTTTTIFAVLHPGAAVECQSTARNNG